MSTSNSAWLSLRSLLIIMATLTALTWWAGTQINRYTTQILAVPSDFPGDASQWQLQENWKDTNTLEGFKLLPGAVQISRNEKGISSAEIRVPLPAEKPSGAVLLASAELVARNVKDGIEDWHGLLYSVWFYDANGQRIKKSARTVQALRGTTVPLFYSREIDLPAQAVEAGIGIRLFESTGTATMRSPSLQVVSPWSGYKTVTLGVLCVWVAYGLLVVGALASQGRLLYALAPIGLIAVIAAGVSLPNQHLQNITGPMEAALSGIMPQLQQAGLYSFNKVGHAVTFAMLCLLACVAKNRIAASWLGIACFMILLALLTEGVQLFFVGRSTRLVDMAIDLGGALVGAAIFFVLWLLSRPFAKRH